MEQKMIVGNEEPLDRCLVEKASIYQDDRIMIIEHLHEIDLLSAPPVRLESYMVVLCLKGKGQVSLNNNLFEVRKNDLVICHPRTILEHSMVSVDFECCGFCLSPNYANQITLISSGNWNFKMYIEEHPIISLSEEEGTVFYQYYSLLRSKLQSTPHRHQKELIDALLQAFIYDFSDSLDHIVRLSPPAYNSAENLFNQFINILSASYPKPRSVAFYADKLHVTSKYLSAICKKVSGNTASSLIEQYVMKDIQYLLKKTTKSIKEIVNELDFPSISFFGKYVKQHVGMSPKQYRAEPYQQETIYTAIPSDSNK